MSIKVFLRVPVNNNMVLAKRACCRSRIKFQPQAVYCLGRIAKLASSASCFLLVFWTLFPPRTLDVAFSYNRATRVQRTRIIIGHVHIRILKLTKLVKYAVVCEKYYGWIAASGRTCFFLDS